MLAGVLRSMGSGELLGELGILLLDLLHPLSKSL